MQVVPISILRSILTCVIRALKTVYHQITAMDADVITLETSCSGLQLLDVFHEQGYPNAIGSGVYDLHSPRNPSADNIRTVIDAALKTIPTERL